MKAIWVLLLIICGFMACDTSKNNSISESLELRSIYQKLNDQQVKGLLKKYDIYDKRWHRSGNFQSSLKAQTIKEDKIIIDDQCQLMWAASGSSFVTYYQAKEWVMGLNQKKHAGYADWRLPTLPEALTLLRKKKENNRYINSLFSAEQHSIWTGDAYDDTRIWVVSFAHGGVFKNSGSDSEFVRPVRTLR
jgi:hypothetical protein